MLLPACAGGACVLVLVLELAIENEKRNRPKEHKGAWGTGPLEPSEQKTNVGNKTSTPGSSQIPCA